MPLYEETRRTTNNLEGSALLYVSDSVSDSPEFLEFALKMAERHGGNLELLQVVDPGQASSNPDAHMGAQYSLERLARSPQSPQEECACSPLIRPPGMSNLQKSC